MVIEISGRISSLAEVQHEIANLASNLAHQAAAVTLYIEMAQLKIIPNCVFSMTNLDFLSLENNHISQIQSGISNLTKLKDLYLWSNKLSSLPNDFGLLTNLQILDLSDNYFKSIPNQITNLTKLEELYLHDNNIVSIPTWMPQLTCLKKLVLPFTIVEPPQTIGHLTLVNVSDEGGHVYQ